MLTVALTLVLLGFLMGLYETTGRRFGHKTRIIGSFFTPLGAVLIAFWLSPILGALAILILGYDQFCDYHDYRRELKGS